MNEQLLDEIKEAFAVAVKNRKNWTVYKKEPTYKLEIELVDRRHSDTAEFAPNVKRLSTAEVSFTSRNFDETYKLLQFFAATLPKV